MKRLLLALLLLPTFAHAQRRATEVRNVRGETLVVEQAPGVPSEVDVSTSNNKVRLTDGRRNMTFGFTGFDQLISAQPTQVFEEGFATGLDVEKTWTVTAVGGGTVTVENAQGNLMTTVATDSVKMTTQLPHQYLHGFSNTWRIRCRLGDTVSIPGGIREWGAFDDNNGYFFRLDEDGLHVVIRRLTVDTVIDEASFMNPIPGGVVPTAMSYAIQYLNGNRVIFAINNEIVWIAGSQTGALVGSSQLKTTINNYQTGISTGASQLIEIYGLAVLRDGSPNTYDTIGRLRVTGGVTEAPPGTQEITIPLTPKIQLSANSTVDEFYTITDEKTLTLQVLSAGVESAGSGKGVMIEMFDDPNGDESVLIPVRGAFLIGNNFNTQRPLSSSFAGDGIRRILLRTTQVGASSMLMSREWLGFEQ